MSNKSFVHKTYSRDEILSFTDTELHEAVNKVRGLIRSARRKGDDTIDLEIEFCYLDNERQKREKWSMNSNRSKERRQPRPGADVSPVKPRNVNR